jgi:Zn-dependent M28 family amino/carboxypeptidase
MRGHMRLTTLFLATVLAACTQQVQPEAVSVSPPAVSAPADKLLEDVRILSADDMEGRLVGSPGSAKARAYILARLADIGVAPAIGNSVEHRFETKRKGAMVEGVNLIGLVPGTSGSDRALVLMAHYDHVGVQNGEVYNGADDNASGVATVLKIAASLKQVAPKHDIILALVDAEEGGLSGARAMVADPAFKPLLDRTVMAVNLDMVSRNDKNELYAAGAYHFPWLKPRLDAIAATAPVTLKQGHDRPELKENDWTMQSDHGVFHIAKKPWVYFGVEDHPGYHNPSDDFAAVPADFFQRSATTIEAAVRAFDADLAVIAQESGR